MHTQANEQARGGAKTPSPALCVYPSAHTRVHTHAHLNGQHTAQSIAGRQTPGLRSHSMAASSEPRLRPRAGACSHGKVTGFAGGQEPGTHGRSLADPEESQLPREAEVAGCHHRRTHIPRTRWGRTQTPTPQPLSAHRPAALAEREQHGSKAELRESFPAALRLPTRVPPLLQIMKKRKKIHSPDEIGRIWVFMTF